MSTRFTTNERLIKAIESLVAKCNATGNISVLPERCDRAEELTELVRHGNHYGYDIRNYGFKGVELVHGDGYLTDIIVHEDLLTLDYRLMKHLEKEINDRMNMLHRIAEEQSRQYWEDVEAGLYD